MAFMMLVCIIDQTLWPTLLYLSVAAGLYHFLGATSTGYVLSGLPTLLWLRSVVSILHAEFRIAALGGRTTVLRSWTPGNVQLIRKAVWYFKQGRNEEFWFNMFGRNIRNGMERPYTVETAFGGQRILFTADDENIKAVLATQFHDFGKGDRFQSEWNEFLGHSIFTTDGKLWHNSRSLLRPQFAKDRVADLHTFETHVTKLLPLLAGSYNGATVVADDLFFRFTLDTATDFLLGHSVDSLVNGQASFATAFTEVQHVQATVARAGPLKWFVPRKSFKDGLKVINEFIGHYVDRALQLPQDELEKLNKGDDGYTFLHALVGHTRDRQVLRDQIIATLLAGRDTTAVTFSWLFYQLSQHPQAMQKLRAEVLDTVGPTQKPTYAHLKSMRYLQHALNETLRLYPVVPFNVRESLKDTTLPRGGGPDGTLPIGIRKGTPIGYSTLVLQHRPDVYPAPSAAFPSYLEWAPERWDGWTPKSWTYIPFNGGPRICIGQQFALTELAYTVVRILQTYDRVEYRMDRPLESRSEIVLQPAPRVDLAFFKSAV